MRVRLYHAYAHGVNTHKYHWLRQVHRHRYIEADHRAHRFNLYGQRHRINQQRLRNCAHAMPQHKSCECASGEANVPPLGIHQPEHITGADWAALDQESRICARGNTLHVYGLLGGMRAGCLVSHMHGPWTYQCRHRTSHNVTHMRMQP